MKKIFVQFSFPGTTTEQYDNAWREIHAAGYDHPAGLLYHVGGQHDNDLLVVAVWESEEAFLKFGETLLPVLGKNGFPQVKPVITPVHYELTGAASGLAH